MNPNKLIQSRHRVKCDRMSTKENGEPETKTDSIKVTTLELKSSGEDDKQCREHTNTYYYIRRWEAMAELHVRNSSWNEAIKCYSKILQLPGESRSNFKVLARVGMAYLHSKNYSGALIHFMAAQKVDGQNDELNSEIIALQRMLSRQQADPDMGGATAAAVRTSGGVNESEEIMSPPASKKRCSKDGTNEHASSTKSVLAPTPVEPIRKRKQQTTVPSANRDSMFCFTMASHDTDGDKYTVYRR